MDCWSELNTGSIIAISLLLKGEKVRVVGRDGGRYGAFARKERSFSRPT